MYIIARNNNEESLQNTAVERSVIDYFMSVCVLFCFVIFILLCVYGGGLKSSYTLPKPMPSASAIVQNVWSAWMFPNPSISS